MPNAYTSAEVAIRRATAADTALVGEVDRRSRQWGYQGILPAAAAAARLAELPARYVAPEAAGTGWPGAAWPPPRAR